MKKQNLLILIDEGIDINDICFVDDAIKDYEEEFNDEAISKSKLELDTEEIIDSLSKDKKITKLFDYGLRVRPLGLRLKKLDNELAFRLGIVSLFYVDSGLPTYDYYKDKQKSVRTIMFDYETLKRKENKHLENELDTLRKQKIKLMRKERK